MLNEDPVVFMADDKPQLLAAIKRVLADFDAATTTRGVNTAPKKSPETTSQEHL